MGSSASVMSTVTQPLRDNLLLELLMRLPIKKVIQFRCVSKHWSSIISKHSFIEAYNTRNCSTGLVYFVPGKDGKKHRFRYSALRVQEPQKSISHVKYHDMSRRGSTQIVNGLVCFQSDGRLFVGNVLSGETKRLPDPPLLEGCMAFSKYHFGFDPVNRVYKLLRLSSSMGGLSKTTNFPWFKVDLNLYTSIHILTIGDSSWRELACGASELDYIWACSPSILVDGVLYLEGKNKFNVESRKYECRIVAFDLSKEKFRLVHPPPEGHSRFVQFRGRLSVMGGGNDGKLIFHSLDDDEGHSWSRYETTLPKELQDSKNGSCGSIFSMGNLPTGEILLVNRKVRCEYSSGVGISYHTPVYSFDHENKKFMRFVVWRLPEPIFHSDRVEAATCVKQKFEALDALILNPSSGK